MQNENSKYMFDSSISFLDVQYYSYYFSEEKAKEFLLKMACIPYPIGLDEDEKKRAEELFPDIFEEDA